MISAIAMWSSNVEHVELLPTPHSTPPYKGVVWSGVELVCGVECAVAVALVVVCIDTHAHTLPQSIEQSTKG